MIGCRRCAPLQNLSGPSLAPGWGLIEGDFGSIEAGPSPYVPLCNEDVVLRRCRGLSRLFLLV
ncbi:hypothetical protein CH63R_06467 [Colletotrichum higginsianum IMI 349063]|uniref:Uncharacterized protein n=1 Tax=Colletotrichum higginsianum (strain IMI 349063) TaxID=759273 RepID=A0A1B7YFH8_COLHI|nr:hypothetical protein CH63R_06467 [Colletotrichum higginsianum IMI 349063]OBR10775.1 hypothetical protein CH63R_06467 [Colletotrichum higginsianum IMI 349063]GJD01001.1 hypothetical protein ColKHC_09826 [Colletotrichum higginsianum]